MKKMKLKKTICTSIAALSVVTALSHAPVSATYINLYANSDGARAEVSTTGIDKAKAVARLRYTNGSKYSSDTAEPGTAIAALSASDYSALGTHIGSLAQAFENDSLLDSAPWGSYCT